MNRLILMTGCIVLWSSALVAQAQDLIFEHGFENDPDAVGILSLTANPAFIFEGEGTTINWTLKDAASCVGTDGTAAWQAFPFDGNNGSFAVAPLATQGVYPFTLTCTGSTGDPPTDTKTINVDVSVPPPVQILSFNATPDTIEQGESTTLSWTLQDAVSCTTSGGTAQWQALSISSLNSSVQITDLDSEGIFQFALNCDGFAGDSAAAVTSVNVENLTCQTPTLDAGNNVSWLSFWGYDFPDSNATAISQAINTGHYLSVQFDTGNIVNNGRFIINDGPGTLATRLATVSRCIGRFEAVSECTHTGAGSATDQNRIDWATDGKTGACALEPNTTYFLNVTFTNGVNSDTDSCTTDDCLVSVEHQLNP